MNQAGLQEDWLAGNAVVAFVGALLMAQRLQLSDSASGLAFNVPFLTFPDIVLFSLVAFFFALSLALALASLTSALRSWALRHTSRYFSPALGTLTWAAFTLGWLGAFSELSLDQWWTPVLFLGGFGFFLFLGYRMVRAYLAAT